MTRKTDRSLAFRGLAAAEKLAPSNVDAFLVGWFLESCDLTNDEHHMIHERLDAIRTAKREAETRGALSDRRVATVIGSQHARKCAEEDCETCGARYHGERCDVCFAAADAIGELGDQLLERADRIVEAFRPVTEALAPLRAMAAALAPLAQNEHAASALEVAKREIDTFDLEYTGRAHSERREMVKADAYPGDWVRFEDHTALVDDLVAAAKATAEQIDTLTAAGRAIATEAWPTRAQFEAFHAALGLGRIAEVDKAAPDRWVRVSGPTGDWVGFYRNGHLMAEGHSVDGVAILESLGFKVERAEFPAEWEEIGESLPDDLSDIPGVIVLQLDDNSEWP